jgi:adenosylhomocysteine nucleosidase
VTEGRSRHVVVLAPMPLEMNAITRAFGLTEADDGHFRGQVGLSTVSAVHIGMGPAVTRAAIRRLASGPEPVDHFMIAGICGGLDPALAVGTLINPEILVDHASGNAYRHRPPGHAPVSGKLVTTEVPTLDHDLSRHFFAEGCLAVDMESAAVAEVCGELGYDWSVYRCIGDRYFDGLLDERVLALSKPDGSGDHEALVRLLETEPEIRTNLERLGRETSMAAKLAAEAAVSGCLALDA